jgi:hypothetical protein
MILTGKQIVELARLGGFTVSSYDKDMLETEFVVEESEGGKIAYYVEYPDEGVVELG